MSLSKYNQKRNFKETKEPVGKKPKATKPSLIFVVQQHSASHLHYDFRLEMEGVLKSWAVPKGPSMNPADKRLAMMVEDHPYDYKDFEGTIPEGNYGAGNVIVWDNGTYHSIYSDEKDETENELLSGLHKGEIKFILKGKKLKGEFVLVKTKGRGENSWLLIKKKDKYAIEGDILKKNKSIISGKPLVIKESKKEIKARAKKPAKTKQKKSPQLIKPMLATLSDEAFDSKEWVFETKYDGYRAVANTGSEVKLYSRNLLPFTATYPSIAEELKLIKEEAIIDGEIVVENEKGISSFQSLQNYQRTGKGKIRYYVFDLISLNNYDTTKLTLLERKELLKELLSKYKLKNILFSEHIEEKGINFFRKAEKNKWEGIIAKKKSSIYQTDTRSKDWLKIKIQLQQEVVIAGITEPKGSRKFFGSLILGVTDKKGKLTYVGNCGTGFDHAILKELYSKLKPNFTTVNPFGIKIKTASPIQWVKPEIICEVKFSEWTEDKIMRHPVYLGLRADKSVKETKAEIPEVKTSKLNKAPVKRKKETKKSSAEKPELIFTNRDKLYWKKEKITKGELIDYYDSVSKLILPYLKDRPQSLHRFPNGIESQSFFQKDIDINKTPSWLHTEKVFSESTNEYVNYLICNDRETLLYMANLGCIEVNPWNSKIQTPENPDWLVIDLDPEKIDFKFVVQTALVVKEVFDEYQIKSYCKTSGSTGLHIYIPLAGKYDYDITKTFAELIAKTVHSRLPDITSVERSPSKRQGKVYLDFLQNRRGQTLAAPYSVRPKPGATVSTPLDWTEVNKKLSPSMFTMKNILKRIDKVGDLWKPVIGKGVDIRSALSALSE